MKFLLPVLAASILVSDVLSRAKDDDPGGRREAGRQKRNEIVDFLKIPLTVFTAVVSARLLTDHFNPGAQPTRRPTTRQTQPEKFILKNDPQCGLPAGGTFCDLDCERLGDVYKDPACLRDCSTPSCFALLMEDHAAHNGVCFGSFGHKMYNWRASDARCQMDGVDVVEGLCSTKTIQALIQPRCVNSIFSLPFHLKSTINSIIRSLCRHEVHDYFSQRPILPCQEDCVTVLPSPVPWFGNTNIGYQDLNCLSDCTETNCLSLLFTDFYNAGGVCAGSYADVQLNWPVSSTTVEYEYYEYYGSGSGYYDYGDVSSPCQMEGKTITSPNYPNNYPTYTRLYYNMTAPAGQSVHLQFTTFDLEPVSTCEFDWVMILDSEGEELLSKSCGREIPDIISFTTTATLIFHSDCCLTRPGFSANLSQEVIIVISSSQSQTVALNVFEGLCSSDTIASLIQQSCINDVWTLSEDVRNPILYMIRSLCPHKIYDYFSPRPMAACEQDCVNVGFLPSPPNPTEITEAQIGSGAMIYEDLNCLSDCSVLETTCVSLLFTDYYNAGGVCAGSYADVQLNWTVSSRPCQMEGTDVQEGLCSSNTNSALIQQPCINNIWTLSEDVRNTILYMIRSLCPHKIYDYFSPRPMATCEQDCVNVGFLPSPPTPAEITEAQFTSGALIYEDLNCVSDCSVLETHCVSLLFTDYNSAGGVCAGTEPAEYGWPVSTQPCETTVEYEYYDYWDYGDVTKILEGLCRPETEQSLTQERCVNEVYALDYDVRETILQMIRGLCRSEVYANFYPRYIPPCASDCINTLTSSGALSPLYEDMSCLDDCGTITITTTTTTITSPNYPDNYPTYTNVYYNMTAPAGQSVKLQFTTFNVHKYTWTPTCYDWVMILDSKGKELLSTSCGTEIPEIISFTNTATLVFSSDSEESKTGFSATLSIEASVVITELYTNPNSRTLAVEDVNTRQETREGRFLVRANFSPVKPQVESNKNQSRFPALIQFKNSSFPFFMNSKSQIKPKLKRIKPLPDFRDQKRDKFHSPTSSSPDTKLNPIQEINDWDLETATKPVFENTRGRYPWICSFRGRQDKSHYCGATILSRPPGPLVIVTAAHCVFLCKSEAGDTVPNCCCENVKGKLCLGDDKCGDNPSVEVMTGEDAEVICGEFETGGNYTAEESGEDYNIVLQIASISVHPDYNITRGVNNSQYVVNDIATLHLQEILTEPEISQLTPACLPQPQSQPHSNSFGLHAGWSAPPPPQFIQEHHPLFEPFTRDFHKMMHYNMSLLPCQDPKQYFNEEGATGVKMTYKTNSYYPPGTICAREKNSEFCPTSGESGSPLMVQDGQGRFSALGVNSFLKGCSSFSFTDTTLKQFSANPIVYSRLSCFLPWIAEQYNMTYTATEEEPECTQGVGNINEVTTEICRITPSENIDIWWRNEAECIFPFTLDNVTHNQCTLSQLSGFTRPQFFCPIRRLRGRGTNYTTADSDTTFCPTNYDVQTDQFNSSGPVYASNNQWELDPDITNCSYAYRKALFATCKNTCPGGGFALLAATSIAGNVAGGALGTAALGAAGVIPALAGLGVVGTAGAGAGLMALAECMRPVLCVAPSGQCCLTTMSRRGLQCPPSC